MTVLFCADERFREHDSGWGHPERPERLDAAVRGIGEHGLLDVLMPFTPRDATDDELAAVHDADHIRRVDRFSELGGGNLDADTVVGFRSAELARLASGATLTAVESLRNGVGGASAAFVVPRPPGHHATADRAMGFCLYNHVAVAAAAIAAAGERVVVVDIDAHHGNGTQDIFYDRGDVMYVSWHQSPHYPHSGHRHEIGEGDGRGTTLNIPMPAGATGEHWRRSIDELVGPAVAEFTPDWLLLSAGYDTHRADPLCDLALTSGDVADIVGDLLELVPPQRTVAVMEGGYDLDAIAACAAATVGVLAGIPVRPEAPTSGGPGAEFVDAARDERRDLLER